ncbi:hypothetical protein BN107_000059 [Lactobacillus phage phiAQ113]|uniref:hypothetical protein n=1 Tax=Lactobacillus phage phiAQ113 TaxID=1206110 RepID=UPI00029FC1D6|nr:hypothetical protein BN107_000059 [Lactobacillus phage phiAQ113]WFD53010.1 hypothetical protein [Lactobacillus phage P185]WFF43760.1 hypothetical protein [Lactobacillus phage CR28]CCI88369.1 hypothetical protein BN107_000059 [Lactobacillus phage phiAQ113]
MALVVVNMGIIFAIVYVIWTISIIAYVYSNYKNKKSNQDLSEEIHKSNDLNDQLLETVKKYCDSTERKSTAQDNIMWESILILARRIHDLEESNAR